MIRHFSMLAVFVALPLLQGCESVSRFGDSLDPRSLPPSRSSVNNPSAISATPTPSVIFEPLPPPPPRFAPSVPNPVLNAPQVNVPQPGGLAAPLIGGVVAPQAGGLTGGLTPVTTKTASLTPAGVIKSQRIVPVESVSDNAPEKPSQSRLTGGWSVAQGSGSKCKLTLSNAPALDLYKAQTIGCGAGLTKVNAWELRGDEIYLYEQGGGVAARLKQVGNSSFNGSAAKTGAPMSISK